MSKWIDGDCREANLAAGEVLIKNWSESVAKSWWDSHGLQRLSETVV